ncbi:hypothetical protein H6P81_019284 [Aristolochia fimbriata]|uniref:Uncharacterized protein n=1 Tax=Aristolochia fimbriata TaxID=158543 RepID=A0AAV7DSZ0_ARIFI|nr:hypothetical protein H6P81_019284 [Aristolochia fimbriata]
MDMLRILKKTDKIVRGRRELRNEVLRQSSPLIRSAVKKTVIFIMFTVQKLNWKPRIKHHWIGSYGSNITGSEATDQTVAGSGRETTRSLRRLLISPPSESTLGDCLPPLAKNRSVFTSDRLRPRSVRTHRIHPERTGQQISASLATLASNPRGSIPPLGGGKVPLERHHDAFCFLALKRPRPAAAPAFTRFVEAQGGGQRSHARGSHLYSFQTCKTPE